MAGPTITAILGLDGSGFLRGLNKAKSQAHSFGNELSNELKGKFAAAFGTAAIAEASRRTIEYGHHIKELSIRLGVSTDAIQEWDYAAKHSGGSLEDVTKFIEKMGRAREAAFKPGGESMAESFERLGVSIEDLKTKRLEDLLLQISKTVQNGDPQKLGAALQAVGGRGSPALITMMREGLAEAAAEAHNIGAIIDKDVVDAFDRIVRSVDKLIHRLRGDLARALGDVVEAGTGAAGWLSVASAYWGVKSVEYEERTKAIIDAMLLKPKHARGHEANARNAGLLGILNAAGIEPDEDRRNENLTGGLDDLARIAAPAHSKIHPLQLTALQQIGAEILSDPIVTESRKTNMYLARLDQNVKALEAKSHAEPELE